MTIKSKIAVRTKARLRLAVGTNNYNAVIKMLLDKEISPNTLVASGITLRSLLSDDFVSEFPKWKKVKKLIDKQQNNQIYLTNEIRHLVFEGGGAKGIVYLGVYKYLEEIGLLKNIENVAGSSAGALNACLMAAGLSAKDLHKQMTETNLNDLKDIKHINYQYDFFGVLAYLSKWINGLSGIIGKNTGIYEGEKIKEFLAKAYEEQLGDVFKKENEYREDEDKLSARTLTFKQLNNLKRKYPELGLKNPFFTGSNLDTGKLEYYSYKHTPNAKVINKAQISAAFPLAYKARNGVTDGGMFYNLPMGLFDTDEYTNGRFDLTGRANPQVIGFKLYDSKKKHPWYKDDKKLKSSGSFGKIIKGIVWTAGKQNLDLAEKYPLNVVPLLSECGTLEFDLSDEKRDALIKAGYDHAKRWFELYRPDGGIFHIEKDNDDIEISKRPEVSLKTSAAKLAKLEIAFMVKIFKLERACINKSTCNDTNIVKLMEVYKRLSDLRSHPKYDRNINANRKEFIALKSLLGTKDELIRDLRSKASKWLLIRQRYDKKMKPLNSQKVKIKSREKRSLLSWW